MSAQSQTTQSSGQSFATAIPRGRKFWLYLVLAAFVALVALGPSDGEVSLEANRAQDASGATPSENQPVFDGRGKWGGYAR